MTRCCGLFAAATFVHFLSVSIGTVFGLGLRISELCSVFLWVPSGVPGLLLLLRLVAFWMPFTNQPLARIALVFPIWRMVFALGLWPVSQPSFPLWEDLHTVHTRFYPVFECACIGSDCRGGFSVRRLPLLYPPMWEDFIRVVVGSLSRGLTLVFQGVLATVTVSSATMRIETLACFVGSSEASTGPLGLSNVIRGLAHSCTRSPFVCFLSGLCQAPCCSMAALPPLMILGSSSIPGLAFHTA
jgi:hypothetical protein